MIVSLNWLKDYIDINDISTEEIVEKLTTSGSEVDEVIDKAKEYNNIVVGYVEDVKKHPNADKLSVCKVSDGTDVFDVVCGAPNVAPGQKVAFAKIGAIIPNGKFVIKKAKIRGEKSVGMICAEDELGISENHEGIMVLSDAATIGSPIVKELKMDDVILDIAVTPNRADSLSHIGMARDLAAIYNRNIKYPLIDSEINFVHKNNYAEVIIDNNIACPRYSAVVVKNIVVKESPNWLKEKLLSIGLRPINNIVDVTNFVLHEMGQPLHAFDLDNLAENKIVVKDEVNEFKFKTLDSKERNMLPSDLMICDGEKPVAVAGVMGGENSEVIITTKNILIESAYFNPSQIRKTAKHLGLSSDASYRFERGTDPNITVKAALRAAQLIKEMTNGEIVNDVIDVYPSIITNKIVSVRFSRIEKLLGFSVDSRKVQDILKGLEFEIIEVDETKITVSIPTFRHDIEREIDLIEEVIRINGFDEIPQIEKISIPLSNSIDETGFVNLVREKLNSLGFNEVISNSLISEEKSLDNNNSIKVLNPQSTEMSQLRTSLIPGMLLNISRNIKVKEDSLQFFEIGHVFSSKSKNIKSFDDISEKENLLIAVCGNKLTNQWYQKEIKFDYYDLLGFVNKFISKISYKTKVKESFNLEPNDIFDYSFEKKIGKETLGVGGKLNSELLKKFEISKDVFLFELNLSILKPTENNEVKHNALLRYPKVYRDFGFVLDKNISYKEVVKTIKNSSSLLLKNVNLFDIFESEALGSDKKSLAFQLEYYDDNRTLREEEVDKEFWNTIETVKKTLNAELRG